MRQKSGAMVQNGGELIHYGCIVVPLTKRAGASDDLVLEALESEKGGERALWADMPARPRKASLYPSGMVGN